MAQRRQQTGGGTPAVVLLERAGVAFAARVYDHDPAVASYGLEAAALLGVEPARVLKTLLLHTDASWAVGIVPVDRTLDVKAFAAVLGSKKAEMTDPATAERVTGYVVGGISPLGQKKCLPTVLDSTATQFATVLVSGGKRGFDLELAPQDLIALTRATLAPIAR